MTKASSTAPRRPCASPAPPQAHRLFRRADNGYTPSTVVLDAPIEIDQGPGLGVWAPENYAKKFYGPQTLRFGLEQSRNVMTVRLAQDIGMPLIADYAKRFGVYDDMLPVLSMSLGAGETTLMRMVGAYAIIANGGRKVTPSLIDRVQDRYGHTIFRHDERECRGCDATSWQNQPEPTLLDRRPVVLDAMSTYQITSMMEGVIPARHRHGAEGSRPPCGRQSGTTNDEKDAWFIAFTPDMVVGMYLGYDRPRAMGKGATGGVLTAPIVRDFMKSALGDKPAVPFRVPPGIKQCASIPRPACGRVRVRRPSSKASSRHCAAGQLFHHRHDRRLGGRLAGGGPGRALGHGWPLLASLTLMFRRKARPARAFLCFLGRDVAPGVYTAPRRRYVPPPKSGVR